MATTLVYESYRDFCQRADKEDNGIGIDVLMGHYRGDLSAALADNATNAGCWDCTGCRGCRDCSEGQGLRGCCDCHGCTGCTNCEDLSDGHDRHGVCGREEEDGEEDAAA